MLIGTYHERPYGEEVPQRLFAGRLNTAYGTNFNNIDWLDSQLLVETTSRIGVDAGWRWLTEDAGNAGSRELHLGDANLFFRFAQGSTLEARAGLGFHSLVELLVLRAPRVHGARPGPPQRGPDAAPPRAS